MPISSGMDQTTRGLVFHLMAQGERGFNWAWNVSIKVLCRGACYGSGAGAPRSITLGLRKWRDVTAQKHFNTDTVCLESFRHTSENKKRKKEAFYQSCKWGVNSHKGAYCATAGSKLEVIVGQNQCCLPLGGVSISLSSREGGRGSLPPRRVIDSLRRTWGKDI